MSEDKIRVIVSRRCDEPMARRKGLLGYCQHRCSECLCCIEKDAHGSEQHVSIVRGGDPGLIARNLLRYSPRKTETNDGKRGRPISSGGKRI